MAHITKQKLEERARAFEPHIFKSDDPLWKPAQDNIRAKIARMLISGGDTVEGYEQDAS